jgi:hypothetical protein
MAGSPHPDKNGNREIIAHTKNSILFILSLSFPV